MAARTKDSPRFLLATDLSPESAPHLRHAARLAEQFGARATLYHALLPRTLTAPTPGAVVPQQTEVLADRRAAAQRLARTFGSTQPVEVEVTEARDERAAVLAAADRIDALMIVLATHGRSGLQRAVLGSSAEQILRRAHRPVLLLTDRMLPAAGDAAPLAAGPVVVATDLSPLAVSAHRPAAELAQRLGRPMALLSVLPHGKLPFWGGGAAATPPPSDPQLRSREHAALLRRHAAEIGHDRPVEVLALLGDDVAGAIVRGAQQLGACLLVLATHGRRGIARLLQGSIAEQVVRHATVPVVCMPRPE